MARVRLWLRLRLRVRVRVRVRGRVRVRVRSRWQRSPWPSGGPCVISTSVVCGMRRHLAAHA